MKLIEPKVELWGEEGVTPEQHIARCARVCYNKEDKIPDQEADKKMVDGLISRGHLSMLRHASYYGTVNVLYVPWPWQSSIFVNKISDDVDRNIIYASTNGQLVREMGSYFEESLSPSEFLLRCQTRPELFSIFRLTFCIITQISTSRELNRVSPNNIAERSTRYCSSKDGLEICKPWWWNDHRMEDAVDPPEWYAYYSWMSSERMYQGLLGKGKMKPEDARGVLPLDTATKVIYTYSIQEWKHIIDLRYYGTTGAPHPNAKLVIGMVRDKINEFAKANNIDYKV